VINPNDPIRIADGLCADGAGIRGQTLFGRFADFVCEQDDQGSAICKWSITPPANYDSDDMGVFVFLGASYFERSVDATEYVLYPEEHDGRVQVDWMLFPNENQYENWPYLWEKELRNRVALAWDISTASTVGECSKVRVHKNDAGEASVNTTTAIKEFRWPTISVDGSNCTVSGRWTDKTTTAVDLTLSITTAGDTGTAVASCTYAGQTKTLTTQTYSQMLFNGIRVKWADTTFTTSDSWTIRVGPAEAHTTGTLANGNHIFQIATLNPADMITWMSSTTSLDVQTVPASATATDYVYSGSGVASLRWTMPSDVDVDRVKVYRNYPEDGLGDLVYPAIADRVTAPGNYEAFDVTDLQPGINRFVAWVSNDYETNHALNYHVIILDDSLLEVSEPTPPFGISAELQETGAVRVTVHADNTSTGIQIYGDATTGTIDYATVLDTITNPQASGVQELTTDIVLADGTYQLGARAKYNNYVETNTDVTCQIIVDTRAAPAATSLTASLV